MQLLPWKRLLDRTGSVEGRQRIGACTHQTHGHGRGGRAERQDHQRARPAVTPFTSARSVAMPMPDDNIDTEIIRPAMVLTTQGDAIAAFEARSRADQPWLWSEPNY